MARSRGTQTLGRCPNRLRDGRTIAAVALSAGLTAYMQESARLQTQLHNPAYARIYAYGRRRTDSRRKQPGRPMTGRTVRDRQEWHVAIPDVFPAYISVEQFDANEAKLAANRARSEAQGAPRTGPSLAAGLIWCGRLGRRMMVRAHVQDGITAVEYACNRDVTTYGHLLPCQSLSGACLEEFVAAQVPAALAPAAVEVSLHAADQVIAEREQSEKLWSSAWNARPTRPIGLHASTGWPSRRTAWSPGNWNATGSRRWPAKSA